MLKGPTNRNLPLAILKENQKQNHHLGGSLKTTWKKKTCLSRAGTRHPARSPAERRSVSPASSLGGLNPWFWGLHRKPLPVTKARWSLPLAKALRLVENNTFYAAGGHCCNHFATVKATLSSSAGTPPSKKTRRRVARKHRGKLMQVR